ncbi:MAG: polysaccharide deacetylase family protein [Lachnospiraceae bacterium]|nr:polysaccharide deacetylase family protein [Lachnospiraceae bacterium]
MSDPKMNNSSGRKQGSGNKKNSHRHTGQGTLSTVLGIVAIALVCTVVYLMGRTGIIRVNGSSGQASGNAVTAKTGSVVELPILTSDPEPVSESSPAESEPDVKTFKPESAASGAESAASTAEKISPSEKKKKKEAESAPAPAEPVTVYTTDSVNVRSGPSTDADIVAKILAGTSVTKTGEKDGWTVVDYDGQTAYIKSDYVEETQPYEKIWDLQELSNEPVNFGYAQANRDENNVPTDWEWYESKWGRFNVDWIQDTGKNIIYLTMDEGFANDTTAGILDTLAAKGVKATFFLTKYFADEMPEMIQRMIDEGHQLGNHTCTHPNMPKLSIEEQNDQIMTLQNQIRDQFGYEMKYFRYPEGVYSDQSLGLVNNLGLKVVFWSYAYNDYSDEQPPVEESLAKAVDAVHPGAIYLLHASSTTNAAFLGDFIDQVREKGFEFGIYPETAN